MYDKGNVQNVIVRVRPLLINLLWHVFILQPRVITYFKRQLRVSRSNTSFTINLRVNTPFTRHLPWPGWSRLVLVSHGWPHLQLLLVTHGWSPLLLITRRGHRWSRSTRGYPNLKIKIWKEITMRRVKTYIFTYNYNPL